MIQPSDSLRVTYLSYYEYLYCTVDEIGEILDIRAVRCDQRFNT
jgi:hypothetical protein